MPRAIDRCLVPELADSTNGGVTTDLGGQLGNELIAETRNP
jgi:hypothetical protein